MSLKKILLSGVAGIAVAAVTSALAGGNESQPMPTTVAGYYLGVNLGYAYQNYRDNTSWRHHTNLEEGGRDNNITGGFGGEGYMGYRLNKNYAFELGWVHLPEVEINASSAVLNSSMGLRSTPAAWMTGWALYLAAKYMMPLCQSLKGDVFFKLGLAYRQATVPSSFDLVTSITSRHTDYVRPMFALGYERTLFDNLFINAQYAYFMGASNSFPLTATTEGALGTVAANVFTLGMAYNFVL